MNVRSRLHASTRRDTERSTSESSPTVHALDHLEISIHFFRRLARGGAAPRQRFALRGERLENGRTDVLRAIENVGALREDVRGGVETIGTAHGVESSRAFSIFSL